MRRDGTGRAPTPHEIKEITCVPKSQSMMLSIDKRDRHKDSGKHDPRLRIIRAADNLFRKKGVKATSTGGVMKASRSNSGQFCYCFRNKRLLVQAVLQTYVQSVVLGNGDMDSELKS